MASLGTRPNAWHRHFPSLVTGAYALGSIELLWSLITASVNFCTQDAVFSRTICLGLLELYGLLDPHLLEQVLGGRDGSGGQLSEVRGGG